MATDVVDLERRVARIERELRLPAVSSVPQRVERPVRVAPPVASIGPEATREVASSPLDRERPALEDLFGGRVLAWVGGAAVLAGLVLLTAMAIAHGWIGPAPRTGLAGLGSLGLVLGAMRLRTRGAATEAVLAMAGTGIAGGFVTACVGGPVLHVLPEPVSILLALVTGAAATVLAVRWRAQAIAALGLGGALLSPVLAGADPSAASAVVVWIAGAAAVGVLLWQRWTWLSALVFVLALPQGLAALAEGEPSVAGVLFVLVAFGLLNAAAAVAYELRVPAARLRPGGAMLLTLNAAVLGGAGWFWLSPAGTDVGGTQAHPVAFALWLAALGAAHVAAGARLLRSRAARDVGLLCCALGLVSTDCLAATLLHGPALALAWATGLAGLAALGRVTRRETHDEAVLGLGLGGHLLLAAGQALVSATPAQVAHGGSAGFAAATGVAVAAAGSFAASRLVPEREGLLHDLRPVLDGAALLGLAYLSAVLLDGVALVTALSAEAAALAALARRAEPGEREVAEGAALAFLAAALGHVLVLDVPPSSFVEGVRAPLTAIAALGAPALALTRTAWDRRATPRQRDALLAGAGALLLVLASVLVVTPFQPGDTSAPLAVGDLGDLGVRQQGQLLLSALWTLTGTALLVAGLRRDVRNLRLAALGLLGATAAKVFLFDLATLTSAYRVVSFVGLGLALLTGAHLWQRARPAGA